MYIANAVYYSKEFNTTRLKICTAKEADSAAAGADPDKGVITLHYSNPLAELIMQLAVTQKLPVEFEFRGDACKLLSYSFNDEEKKYNRFRPEHITATKKLMPYHDEIVVYSGRCRCPKCYPQYAWETIENICGIVTLEKGGQAKIDLQWCKHCATYFIDEQSLGIYERRYGRLRIHRLTMRDFVRRPSAWTDGAFAEDSILSRNGYLAEYSTEIRHRALECMLENGISKAEIKNKLTEFIELRGDRCHRAVFIWMEDLEYVNDYCLESERKIVFQDKTS